MPRPAGRARMSAFMRVVTRPETDPERAEDADDRARGSPGGRASAAPTVAERTITASRRRPGDIEIEKLMFDSFHGTDLDAQLRAAESTRW
ncbi:MAG: hypothetical protein QM744_02475 [Mesorhizobium sp.]